MAIEGNLLEMPLPSLIPALRRRCGALEVWDLGPGRFRFRLFSRDGTILAIDDPAGRLDAIEAKQALQLMMTARNGSFRWFDDDGLANIDRPLQWPMETAVSSSTQTAEASVPSHSVPSSAARTLELDTRYEVIDTLLEPWLEEDLFDFWVLARPHFHGGITPRMLAVQCNESEDAVLRHIARLRTLGKVAPVRAFTKETANTQRRGIAARLIGALRRGRR